MAPSNHLEPPRFTVDLSLPPRARYTHIVPHFLPYLTSSSTSLTNLYKSLIDQQFETSPFVAKALQLLSHLVFTRLASKEETEEVRGISEDTNIPMYILVAFNCLLDLFMGCTSGGIRCMAYGDSPQRSVEERLVHFRTLDWSMDVLRPLTVELDFIRSAKTGDEVIATSITYFGYIGVLTGVRKGLSVSLNFRPHHDGSTRRKEWAFRLHQAMVLLGWRRGISSLLRDLVLGDASKHGFARVGGAEPGSSGEEEDSERVMADILSTLPSQPSTAAYLILCTPQKVYNIEKDHRTGTIFSSPTFQTTCNHDQRDETHPADLEAAADDQAEMVGMHDIVSFSMDRKERLEEKRKRAIARRCKKERRPFDESAALTMRSVVSMVMDRHISNEETHYSAIMDPGVGKVVWRRVFEALPEEFDEEDEVEALGR